MTVRITLNHIKKVGLASWPGLHQWDERKVRIWSQEHHAWWRPEAKGYTLIESEAGIYDFIDALNGTKHCGPEKRIVFYAALSND